jgi:DNA-binding transcriptional LysR family regulator
MITHRQVEVFHAVVVCSNMTEAGRMLSVTQSAISKIMKEFEREVGFSLFHRRKGGLEPTAEAFNLYDEVQKSYLGLDKIAIAAQRIRSREYGRLVIGCMPAIACGFLQRVIRRFIEDGHTISASIETHSSPGVVDLTETGHCNLGFATTPVKKDRVDVSEVMISQCVCLLPPGHRLEGKKIISIGDLDGEEFISLAENYSTKIKIDALFQVMNVSRKLSIEARWPATVAGFVAEGLGCTITDPFTARLYAASGGVVKPLEEDIPFSFVQIQPKHRLMGSLCEEFLTCFRTEFAKFKSETYLPAAA